MRCKNIKEKRKMGQKITNGEKWTKKIKHRYNGMLKYKKKREK